MCGDPLKLNPQAFVARLCSPICFFVSVCKRSQSNSNHGSCFSSSTAVELSRPNAYQLLTRCQDSYKGQAAWAWLCSWFRSKGMRKQKLPKFFFFFCHMQYLLFQISIFSSVALGFFWWFWWVFFFFCIFLCVCACVLQFRGPGRLLCYRETSRYV